MISFSLNAKGGNKLSSLIEGLPRAMSYGLNDALASTRDKLIRETWPEAMSRGARGRKLTVKRRVQAGREVVRLRRSDETNLNGMLAVDTPGTNVGEIVSKLAGKPADVWIRAFVHSTAPFFASRSKKERIRMALGAYYRALRKTAFREGLDQSKADIFIRDFKTHMIEQMQARLPRQVKRAARGR